MASSSEVGKDIVVMERVSVALRERLGEEAARDLEAYTEVLGDQWREEVMQTATERFDSRLATVASDLRLEMAGLRLDVQKEMQQGFKEVQHGFTEVQHGFAGIWQAMADLRVSLHKDVADTRAELLRWSFLFWVGQVALVAGLPAFMLRGVASR